MEQQIQIKADDATLQGKYSNNMQVAHTKEEFIIDFFNIMPPAGLMASRIITSPAHFKRLVNAMNTNLKAYEDNYGSIKESDATEEHKIGFKTE